MIDIDDMINTVLDSPELLTYQGKIFPRIDQKHVLDSYFCNFKDSIHICPKSYMEYDPETVGDMQKLLNLLVGKDILIRPFVASVLTFVNNFKDTDEKIESVKLYNYMM